MPDFVPAMIPPLASTYDPTLVLLSMAVAALASFVSLGVAARIWSARGWRRACWITAAATAMGGGIWSMHFIAMLALSLPVAVAYDVPLTLLSLVTAIVVTGLAFAIIAGSHGWQRLLVAGAIMGLGVAAMHYTGMSAMLLQAEIFYTPWLFVLSIAIACVAATAALWIAVHVGGRGWRIAAAIIMGGAVSGMHYTGMAAACFRPVASPLATSISQIEPGSLAVVIAIGTLLVLSIETLSAAIDRRFAAFRKREADISRLVARRFEKLVESSNELIVIVDQAGTVAFAASSSRNAIGREPAEIERRNIFDLVTGPGVETLRSVLGAQEAPASFGFVDGLEIRDRQDQVRHYEATVCNLLEETSIEGIVLTFHEVTDRERAAEELRRAKQVSDEANRMKSEFIANMSHELRTPLNAVLGFSEIIAKDRAGKVAAETVREYCEHIHRSAAHLLSIINDILDLSKIEAVQLSLNESMVAPGRLLADCAQSVAALAARKGVRIDSTSAADLPMVRGDEKRLRQVLLNLLSNAVRFTATGGSVDARAGLSSANELEFVVEDTGIGIPEDKLGRIFEPFFQIDGSLSRRQDGTGLGLAIARALAQLHGGRLDLSSRIGQGTTARLILPASRTVP